MRINVINKKRNPQVDDFVREKLDSIVGRFDDRIQHVDVHVVDQNDGKGGEDKICTIDIKLIPRGQLHVRAKNENLYAAISKAIHRAETVVAKAIDRTHRGLEVRHRQEAIRSAPTDVIEEGERN